jgi:hypothetical protein
MYTVYDPEPELEPEPEPEPEPYSNKTSETEPEPEPSSNFPVPQLWWHQNIFCKIQEAGPLKLKKECSAPHH